MAYSSASGHKLPNLGEVKVQGEVEDPSAGAEGGIELTMQVAQVRNPLASVKKMCAAGNRVVFEQKQSYVENLKSGARIPIVSQNGSYHVMLTVPVEKGDEHLLRQNRFAALRMLHDEYDPIECGLTVQPLNSESVENSGPSSSSSGFQGHA